MSGYSSGSPGHDVARVVSNFTRAQFRTLLGTSVLDLVDATIPPADQPAALHRAAVWRLRSAPDDLPREELRDLLLDATPVENLARLAQRVDVPATDALRSLQVEGDTEIWSRFLGFYGLDLPASSPAPHGTVVQNLEPQFGLFPHQRQLALQAYEAVRGGHGRVVLHMPTGTGKTRTAMRVVSRILEDSEPCLVVWLASSAELLEQAADAFSTAWVQYGSRPLGVTRLWGQHSPSLSDIADGLLVAGFQKAHALNAKSMELLRLGARTRLVVVDEAHQAIAPTYRNLIGSLADTGPWTAVLGLTATPGRTWADVEADRQLSDFFGDRKLTVQIAPSPVSWSSATWPGRRFPA